MRRHIFLFQRRLAKPLSDEWAEYIHVKGYGRKAFHQRYDAPANSRRDVPSMDKRQRRTFRKKMARVRARWDARVVAAER